MKPNYRIAIVDDDDGVRQSLSSLVRALGYEVRTYVCAADFLADACDPPDCLLTDVQMPQMDGDQLQAELLARGCRFPMIFMPAVPTAWPQKRPTWRCRAATPWPRWWTP